MEKEGTGVVRPVVSGGGQRFGRHWGGEVDGDNDRGQRRRQRKVGGRRAGVGGYR